MSAVPFVKYHGAGNDFILIDDREGTWHEQFDRARIAAACARRFGVGADGLMFLRPHPTLDFEMIYYNADGAPSSMCGNGARCIVRFAADLGAISTMCSFLAVDGPHRAEVLADGEIALEMADTGPVTPAKVAGCSFVDTGSPHLLNFAYDPTRVNVVNVGRPLRNSPGYYQKGVNVNFLSRTENGVIHIATYERGVEDETLACGTGVTAAALAYATRDNVPPGGSFEYPVRAKGGELSVRGRVSPSGFTDIWLTGPTAYVYRGELPADS